MVLRLRDKLQRFKETEENGVLSVWIFLKKRFLTFLGTSSNSWMWLGYGDVLSKFLFQKLSLST